MIAIRIVPEIGIEPIHHCWRQILSLLRLPISPPGQKKFEACEFQPTCLPVGRFRHPGLKFGTAILQHRTKPSKIRLSYFALK